MRVTIYSSRPYDREFLEQARLAANAEAGHFQFDYVEARLDLATAAASEGAQAVCVFVNDRLDAPVLQRLHALGIRLIVLRSAGFNHVDLQAAAALGLQVGRVPAYSPYAVAEHAAALLLTLNRKIHRAYARVREGNFALEGLLGFDLHGRTVGIVGTGKIGECFARIMKGFGCELLGHDPQANPSCEQLGLRYVPLAELLAHSDIVSLHCPLNEQTRHLINAETLTRMKRGAMLLNTGRGALLEASAAIKALKSGQLGSLGLDVYEEESELFFRDLSSQVLQDDVFARLLTFPNVVITGHQAFFTADALGAIADTTLANLQSFERCGRPLHEVLLRPSSH